jgi:hypothetical protein
MAFFLYCQLWTAEDPWAPEHTVEATFCSLHGGAIPLQHFLREYRTRTQKDVSPSARVAENEWGEKLLAYRFRADPRVYDRVAKNNLGFWCTQIPYRTVSAIALIPRNTLLSFYEGLYGQKAIIYSS